MFILTFNSYPELPKKKSKFYWNVFDTLATKHDSFTKKGGYQHERKTGLQNEEFEKILKWFSYLSLFEGKYSFDSQYLTTKLDDIKRSFSLKYNTQELIEDLTLSISIIIIDGIEYKFPHKSLQEYFCALLIKDLSVNQKEKIYSDKLSQQAKLSFGGNENFWNLCLELDKANFTKFFLIKNLDQIYQELKGKYPLELLRYFYEATNLREDFIYKGNEIYFHSFGWKPNALTQILDFLGIYVPLTLSVRDHENRNQPLLKDLLLKNFTGIVSPIENNTHYYIIYISAWTTEMSKVLTQLGVTSNAVQLVEKIRIKLNELKNDIEQEDLNTINLLELS